MKKCKILLQKFLFWSCTAPALSRQAVIAGLVFCFFLSVGLRILRVCAEPVLSVDGANYVMMADDLQNGKAVIKDTGFSPHWFYSAYLASGVFQLTPHQLGVATNIVLGSLLPLLFFGIAKCLFRNSEIALCCALISAVHPKLVAYSIEVQREIPYMFFGGIFFLCAVLFFRYRKWYYNCGMALAAALGAFFRYEGAELFLFTVLIFTYFLIKEKGKRWNIIGEFSIFAAFSMCAGGLFLILLNFSPLAVIKSLWQRLPF